MLRDVDMRDTGLLRLTKDIEELITVRCAGFDEQNDRKRPQIGTV